MTAYSLTGDPAVTALTRTAGEMVERGRGILAADESNTTMNSRLDKVGLEATPDVRRDYREMLLTAPDLGRSISGVILYDETVRQQAADGQPFLDLVTAAGIIPGIKVDTGAKALAGSAGEKVTEGLDGLADRLEEYAGMGARFAKWRAVITIGDGLPSAKAVHVNAHALGRYAALCQAAGIVPIVEPEVMMTGDHDLARCEQVTTNTLRAVFDELAAQDVMLEGMVLKPNMVVPGESAGAVGAEAVAEATLRCLYRSVPAAVPGIAFLSGGQGDADATAHLQAMNSAGPHPWVLTFSFGRALVSAALESWHGDRAKVEAGQRALLTRARANAAASQGSYTGELEPVPA